MLKNDNVINMETEFILKEAESIYGIDKCLNILRNYASYIKLKKEEKVEFGTFNILIRNCSEYDSSEKLVEVIWKLLKANEIITTNYKYLERDDIRKNKGDDEQSFEEEMLVIDSKKIDQSIRWIKNDVKDLINSFPDKVFIIVDEDRVEGLLNANIGDSLTWTMEIERISKDNKINYIENAIKANKMVLDENNTFVDCLSNEPYWKVKNELVNILLECKIRKVEKITDKIIKEDLKRDYYKETKRKESEKSGMEELDELIGMEEVKNQIKQIVNFVKVNRKRDNMPMLHMCFLGNPGTGKTTVARIVGKIFSEMKILSDKEKFVEAQRGDLIGRYVGQTAPKTMEVVEKADGGVLFIDEAYSVASFIQDEAGADYGAECIATLLKEMEDRRDSLCVVMAGYTNEMEHLLKANPGFASRIQFKIDFPDYSEDDLYEIFKNMVKKENYKLSSGIKQELLEFFKDEKQKENFANARCVRNIFEKVKFEQADRLAKNETDDINLIKKSDIKNAILKSKNKDQVRVKIGFAC